MGDPQTTPTIEAMPLADIGDALADLVARVHGQETRIRIEANGVPIAALVSSDDLDRLMAWERARDERFAVIDRMREAFQDVPAEEIAREAERSVAAARERRRQRAAELAARSA